MAKLQQQFKIFLSNIEPDKKVKKYAQNAHKRVRKCLQEGDKFKENVVGSFLYGSYKRHTAVGDIKDVDVVILTDFDTEDEKNTPHKVLKKLKDALGRCYDNPDNTAYQRRSIRVDDPLPDAEDAHLTLDIIPAVEKQIDNPLLVPDKEQKIWIQSHPKGHLKYTSQLNSIEVGDKKFVPLVKIMKWWWKFQCEETEPEVERPHPKGFWIECLTGEKFDPQLESYANHFVHILQKTYDAYQDVEEVPQLNDPGLDNEAIITSMTLKEFRYFISNVKDNLSLAKEALDEEDKVKSSELWREVFGNEFPLYDDEETDDSREEVRKASLDDSSHAEKITNKWQIALSSSCKVHIDAFTYRSFKDGKIQGLNSNSRKLPLGLWIRFEAKVRQKCDNHEIWWQVVNTGSDAKKAKGLRGNFFRSNDRVESRRSDNKICWETTEYSGKHWIECFVVIDNTCVARSGKFFVNIK